MIPSGSRRATSGWTNYSGKEITHEICENKMDNRGSKSVIKIIVTVKEQRVYGS